jgi:hypothetical protein
MRRLSLLFALAACALTGAVAQPDPANPQGNAPQQPGGGRINRQQPGGQPGIAQRLQQAIDGPGIFNMMYNAGGNRATQVEATPAGLFVLREAVLARMDLKLQQQQTLELFGPMPEMPKAQVAQPDGAPFQQVANPAFQKWFAEGAKRRAPAVMLVDGERLLIVIGDAFFNVNTRTLMVDAKCDLAAQDDLAQQEGIRAFLPLMPPILKVQGDTLFVVRERDVVSVDVKAGKALNRLALPKAMVPEQPRIGIPEMPPPPPPNPPGAGDVPAPFANIGRNAQGADVTVVGKILIIANPLKPNTLAAKLTTDQGKSYLVVGDKCAALFKEAGVEKKRVRASGRALDDGEGNTTLTMTDYQLLED